MKNFTSSILLPISLLFLLSFSYVNSADPSSFIKCVTKNSQVSKILPSNVLAPSDSSYTATYEFSMRNPRFNTSERLKPAVIVTPVADSQVQTVVNCAKTFDMQIRIRSGGHDFEGLSYSSTYQNVPFVLLDMIKLKSVTVDAKAKTAIVQAGATLGEVYYWIYRASGTLAFPAGVWSTVGATGLICGGGYGPLRRKYGLAADNVIDARIVDAKGRILDRQAMGEDVFWALRGGGCASFGIVLSWTLNLVDVPEKVTTFLIQRTLEQNATKIIHPFQTIAPKLPKEVDIRVRISTIESPKTASGKTVELSFTGLYLGAPDVLLKLIQKKLPQLGIVKEDLKEHTWIEAVMESSFFNMFEDTYSPEDLLDRTFLFDLPTKAKSDFVRDPISEEGLDGLWEKLLEVNPAETTIIFTPYGGRLSEIKESALPFPNRAGTLYMVYTRVLWVGDTTKKLEWIRSLSSYLIPYVSSNPRRAYSNYDDIDLGINPATGPITLADAKVWGKAYYKSNFDRLVRVKGMIDPDNFFRHEQSIPPFLPKADM